MEEMMQEIQDIERSSSVPKEESSLASSTRPKTTKMEDLLRKMQRLSAKYKEGPDSSNKEEYEGASTTSTKKMAKKRQKRRKQNIQNRKRRIKNQVDYEIASSSFTDCTDEEILRDYIENITTNFSDSDVEVTLRKGMFLARRDFSRYTAGRLSPEVYETDSLSESLLLTKSRKKRRKYKRHSFEDLQLSTSVSPHQKLLIQKCLKQQYSNNFNSVKGEGSMMLDDDSAETFDPNFQESFVVSDHSESSSNSHIGSEADDEGGESCWEGGASSGIKKVIPWWEMNDETRDDDSMDLAIPNDIEENQELDLSLVKNQPLLLKQYENDVFCEYGWFAAYANHKIRKFVHNRDSNELTLCTSHKLEQEQVENLSVLYQLQYSVEEKNKVALTKTLFTKQADKDALKSFLGRIVKLKCRKIQRGSSQKNNKRRKVGGQASINEPSIINPDLIDLPIADSNLGSQMLRGMGWKPGQGLGKESSGQLLPVKAVKRPRNLGLGHPSGPN